MASSASDYMENQILDSLFAGALYMKLHIGAPGENGTANAAAETTRKAFTLTAAVSGSAESVAQAQWTGMAATEVITALSIWDDATAGNCLMLIDLDVARSVVAGDGATIAAGDLAITAS